MHDETIKVAVTPAEKRRFRIEAARRDISMSQLGREMLSEWLDENASEQPAD